MEHGLFLTNSGLVLESFTALLVDLLYDICKINRKGERSCFPGVCGVLPRLRHGINTVKAV